VISLHKKLLLRTVAVALVLAPIAVGCSADGETLVIDADAGTAGPSEDAGVSSGDDGSIDTGRPDSGRPATSSGCGNKRVEDGEECDDGNLVAGDGCSPTCKRESAGPGDVCADAVPLELVQQGTGTLYKASISGSTSTFFNHYSASCGGGSGADAVFKVTAPMVGRLVARLVAGFPAVFSARTGCEDSKTELGCIDNTVQANGMELAVPIFADAPVYFFVDGYGGSKGDFLLDVEVQTAFCGNGHGEYPEQCDDGNTTDGDGCSATCTLEDSSTPSACPGMAYRLTGSASFAGDTSSLANGGGTASNCASTGTGPNAIYAITPAVTGAIKLDLLANYPNALLHVRRECAGTTNTSQFDCAGATEPLTPLSTTIPVFAEQTIFAFVDSSAAANAGLYALDATLTPAACGNGIVDGGEECDDGNTVSGDACSSTCKAEPVTEAYTCPGKAIRLEGAAPGPRKLTFQGNTIVAAGETLPASKWSNSKACASSSPDVVYRLTSDIDGYLKATVKGGFNAALSLRAACDPDATTEALACARVASGNGPKTFQTAIDKEKDYFLVVDAYAANTTGVFEVTLEVEPSVCGNGIVEGGEECDDGATDDGDGCTAACKLETDKARDECATAPPVTFVANGDGTYSAKIVSGTTNLSHSAGVTTAQTLGTSCSSTGPDAWFAATAPISGVMTATISSATFRSSLGVRNACLGASGSAQLACDATAANGGQQVVVPVTAGQVYPVIVDGQAVTGTTQRGRFTVDLKIVPSGCGDTFQVTPEECDDGNTLDGDGCSSTCMIESLPALASCPGHAVTLSGTGTAVRRATALVSTTGLPNTMSSQCGGSGPEGIVRITSDIAGTLDVRSTADFTTLLYAQSQCGDPTTEINRSSCTSNRGVYTTFVQKDVPTFLYVDGINGASGVAKLQISVTP
jgi:cysteine-rich repeat protein